METKLKSMFVAWKLTPERLKENTERINNFRPDPDLPKSKAVTTQDYKGSGWDRGHLCPAGDNKWDREAMIESFYMTNFKLSDNCATSAGIVLSPISEATEYNEAKRNRDTIGISFFIS